MEGNSNRIIQDYTGFFMTVVLFLFFGLMGSVLGLSVCVDNSDPGAPDGLEVSGDVGGILLEWGAAADEPSCSGIAGYNVSRDGSPIGQVAGCRLQVAGGCEFVDVDSLGEGEYAYTVYAVDLVGKNAGASVKNVVRVSSGGGSSGGGSQSGFVCDVNWSCGEWGECIDGEKRRECIDLNNCGTPYLQPGDWVDCEMEEIEMMEVDVRYSEVGEGFFSLMTGAVVGAVDSPAGRVSGVLVLLVLFGFVAVRIRKRKGE